MVTARIVAGMDEWMEAVLIPGGKDGLVNIRKKLRNLADMAGEKDQLGTGSRGAARRMGKLLSSKVA
jgi:hypothetical protein